MIVKSVNLIEVVDFAIQEPLRIFCIYVVKENSRMNTNKTSVILYKIYYGTVAYIFEKKNHIYICKDTNLGFSVPSRFCSEK